MPSKSEKTKRQELQQARAWIRTFEDGNVKDLLRLGSFLPNMGDNEYFGNAGSKMIRMMLGDKDTYNDNHHLIFDALLQAATKNPNHLQLIHWALIDSGNHWFLKEHIPSIASVFVSAYKNLKPSWRPLIFSWMMSNSQYIESIRHLGFNPEQALYDVDTNSYHDWFNPKAFGLNKNRKVTSWFTDSILQVQPGKMKDPDFLYTLILRESTTDEKLRLWSNINDNVDLQDYYVRGLLGSEGPHFSPVPLLPVVTRRPPNALWWGFMLCAVDCCKDKQNVSQDESYNYHIYKEVWPHEIEWLNNLREVEKGLGDWESPFHRFSGRTDGAFFSSCGAVVERKWLTHMHTSSMDLPAEFDMI